MKTMPISLATATLMLLFAGNITVASAQTFDRPLIGPSPRAVDGQRPLLKDKVLKVKEEAKETQMQFRDELKMRLQNADDKDERMKILDKTTSDRREMLDRFRDRRHEIISDARTDVGRRIKGHFENILNRLDNAIQKFASVLGRIDTHLAKLAERGADVADAETAIAIAEEAVRQASADVDAVHSIFEEATSSDTPRDHLVQIKEAARTASESIRKAHRAIKAAIQELKEAARSLGSADDDDDSQADIDNDADNDAE